MYPYSVEILPISHKPIKYTIGEDRCTKIKAFDEDRTLLVFFGETNCKSYYNMPFSVQYKNNL